MTEAVYVRIRCASCGRLLAEASPLSALRVKCPRCKATTCWPGSSEARGERAKRSPTGCGSGTPQRREQGTGRSRTDNPHIVNRVVHNGL